MWWGSKQGTTLLSAHYFNTCYKAQIFRWISIITSKAIVCTFEKIGKNHMRICYLALCVHLQEFTTHRSSFWHASFRLVLKLSGWSSDHKSCHCYHCFSLHNADYLQSSLWPASTTVCGYACQTHLIVWSTEGSMKGALVLNHLLVSIQALVIM